MTRARDTSKLVTAEGAEKLGIGGGRTQANKNAEIFSVYDAGAVGDGVSDDTAFINSYLSRCGKLFIPKPPSGVYLISDSLIVKSNTTLTIEPGTIFKQKDGSNKSLLVNYAKTLSWDDVTSYTYWTAGTENVLITWVGHNCSVGDAVWLDCENSAVYCGVFTVLSVSGNDITIRLRRRPVANPVGAVRIRKADTNIKVIGGMLDYNLAGNSDGTQSPNAHAAYFAGVRRLKIDNLQAKNTKKYALCVQGVSDYELNVGGYALNSDIVKIYGPAFDGKAKAFGYPGDDMISFQSCEPAAFIAYQVGFGGDIVGATAKPKMDYGAIGYGVMCSIYPHSWGGSVIDDISVVGMDGFCEGAGCQIYDQEGTGGKIGTLRLLNVSGTMERVLFAAQKASGGPSGNTTINELIVSIGQTFKNRTSADLIQINAGVVVDTFIDDGSVFGSVASGIGGGKYINISGLVNKLVFNRTKYKVASQSLVRVDTSAKTISSIDFNSVDFEMTGTILKFDTVTGLGNPCITFNGGSVVAPSVIETVSSANLIFNGTALNMSAQVVLVFGGQSAVVRIDSNVQLRGGTGEWFYANGDALISPRSFDVIVNVGSSYVKREAGNQCTTNAAQGTIPAGSPCICDGTGTTNSWHGVADPANQKY